MLAEDYFGFLNKPEPKVLKRTNKRTELSEEKISSRDRSRREDELGLENLKKKYNEIIGKNKNKKKRKTSTTYNIVQDHYYHGNRMKYYHYNDEGQNPKTKKIKERVQAKALMAFQRVKTETCSETKYIKKRISFQRPPNKVIKNEFAQLKNRNNFLTHRFDKNEKRDNKIERSSIYSYSDSKMMMKQNSHRSRTFRKMKKQEKEKIKESDSKFDDYNPSQMKLQSQVEKSQRQSESLNEKSYERQNFSFQESENMVLGSKMRKSHKQEVSLNDMIGLNSKISEEEKTKKENNQISILNDRNMSSDYLQIKKLQKKAQKQVVNILSQAYQQNNINEGNQLSESSLCLSNVIAESARIFNPTFNGNSPQNGKRKGSSIKPSLLKLKTSSRIEQLERKVCQNTHKQIKPPKIERSSINDSNMSRINFNQSRISSIVNPSIHNKKSPRTLKNSPSCVKQIQSPIEEDIKNQEERSEREVFDDESFNTKVPQNKKKAFNLASSIKMWNYHEKNNSNSEGATKTNSLFEELMNKIHLHLKIINQLSEFVEMTAQMYEQNQSHWIQLQSFIVYKKFYHERVKIVNGLRKGVSCFHLEEAKVSTETLNKFHHKKCLVELTNNVENINKMIENSLQNYYSQIKSSHKEESIVNLGKMREKDVGVILNMLNQQFENIIPRLDQLENSVNEESEDKEILCLRAFRIMETVFLMSELQGRRVKSLSEEEIDSQDFQMYCKEYYGKFKETILYYS